jgi:hypothetical protein
LKQRILSGEFGCVRGSTLSALWPRPASYFSRNNWAGRLMIDDRIVLDSCLGNAMAHFVHNILFWAGSHELFSWAQLAAVRAELYRAHAIEGADTFFVEADTTTGVTMRFALSHACSGASTHLEMVLCDKAVIRYTVGRQIEIRWNDGRTERIAARSLRRPRRKPSRLLRLLRGETPRPATTLVDSRPFVALNNLAHISSARISPIPAELVTATRDEKEQKDYLHVASMISQRHAYASLLLPRPLPLGADDTEYRLLSKEGVSTATFEGREILKVAPRRSPTSPARRFTTSISSCGRST